MPISKEILETFPNKAFIETGTHRGDGVQAALDANCFKVIYSVELLPYGQGWCAHRFWDLRDRVWLFGGDSREFLKQILPKITSPCTFWLDAHCCEGDVEDYKKAPLMGELKQIYEHSINTHIILIDDVRIMGTPHLDVSLDRVTRALRAINNDYIIDRIDSVDFPDDILVAHF